MPSIEIVGLQGLSGGVNTFLGYAPANVLYRHSFADVLDEESGKGYQRRFSDRHSLDFRKYIQKSGSTTIPLTFNLRPDLANDWSIEERDSGSVLVISADARVLAQVDCQHRLGFLADLEISLPFITFVGVTQHKEMAIFNTINSKAKGLPGSLLDFHDTKLISDVEKVKPELVLAVRLNDDTESPWYKMLDLGGNRTSGMQRRASLRTMQKAIRLFIRGVDSSSLFDNEDSYDAILAFWKVVATVLKDEWENPRKHMICKGVGVYSLMAISAEICNERKELPHLDLLDFFRIKFGSFAHSIDWSNTGPLKGLGGQSGVKEAIQILREARLSSKLRAVENGG